MIQDDKAEVVESEMESEAELHSDEPIENYGFSMKLNNSMKRKIADSNTSTKKKGKFEKDLYKQPTVEELNQLRETENLFHSNLFRLQIEEILEAVKIKNKYKKYFQEWFTKFENFVTTIKDTKEYQLNDDTLFEKDNIKIPFKKLPNDCSGTFKFVSPSSVIVGGSYSLNTVVGPNASIDVFVEMPDGLFERADAKNYRYIRKKAIYLAYIAKSIDKDLAESKTFIGNHFNPVLKIIPSGKLNRRFVIYVHVVLQQATFEPNKFTPEKNSVRLHWYYNKPQADVKNPPTPYYNAVVMRDLTSVISTHQNLKIIKEYPNIRDGIILLKIWLKQRELSNNFESFNGHVITMYVLYLLQIKTLNTFMSSYQIVRNTWQNLAKSNWCTQGISLCQNEKINSRIEEYHKYYDCVFLDSTGFQNIASNILEDTFQWISNQAQMAIDCLNNTRVNSFQVLFMRKIPFYKTFDLVVCIHHLKCLTNILESHSTNNDKVNFGPNKHEQAVKLTLKLLKQGLGNRVLYISTLPRKLKEWELSEEIPDDVERLYIGLQLDPNYCFSIIEKGPGANLPEAEKFRKFWGHKSELRRFKDSTICEAVVWADDKATIAQRRSIPKLITKFLLEEKLKLFENIHYFFFSNQLEKFLKLSRVKITKFRYGLEEASLQAVNAFSSLQKELSNLEDLPLSIHGVQGCSPLFRYADIFPPLASVRRADEINIIAGKTHLEFVEDSEVKEVPIYLAPIDAVMQLSMSGKWPDDLEALRMTKAAFHIQIADCLRKQYKLRVHAAFEHIDVMKDGLVFRLRIAHQKEIGLVKQIKGDDGILKYRDNEESKELEEKLFHLPRITGALYGLHCQQPSFGSACCLAKRWLSAQLIDDSHMPDIVVELIMASTYFNSDPYKVAQVPQVAFLRFLEYFAREDWSTEPIVINFNGEMTREEVVEVENLFGTSRDSLPALFISTPYDRQSSMWTQKAPSPLILNRMSSLATEALRLLETQLFNLTAVVGDPLFRPPLSEFDCLIRLKTELNSRRLEALDESLKLDRVNLHPFKEHSAMKMPIVGFDPVAQYLKELRSIYSDFALFFHDTYGGSVIGVLLKPQVLQEKDFKVSNADCQRFNENKKLILNVPAMIEDFYILGKGLIEIIDIQSKKISTI